MGKSRPMRVGKSPRACKGTQKALKTRAEAIAPVIAPALSLPKDTLCASMDTVGLAALPPEIVWCILGHVSHPRDHLACVLASPLFKGEPLVDVVARWPGATVPALLRAGAPLALVKRVVASRRVRVRGALLVPAARGGRLDVVQWIHEHSDPPAQVNVGTCDFHYKDSVCAHGHWSRCCYESGELARRRARHNEGQCALRYIGVPIEAMYEAAHYGRLSVLDWLLTTRHATDLVSAHPIAHGAQQTPSRHLMHIALVEALVVDAVSGPARSTGALAYLHAYGIGALGPSDAGTCRCAPRAGLAAARADRLDALQWMRDVKCDARLDPAGRVGRSALCNAIRCGRVGMARWLVEALEVSRWPDLDPHVREGLTEAARSGHLSTLQLVHGVGAQACTQDVVYMAARHARVDVLRWAMGDETTGAPAAAPRIAGWPSPAIGHAAAKNGHESVVRWLAGRSDARRNLGTGASAIALRKGRLTIAALLHDVGIAPFDRWDSLHAAVCSGQAHIIRRVIAGGAAHSALAVAKAIRLADTDILALLCEHYGTGRLQRSINILAGKALPSATVGWIAANAPHVCVAEAGAWSRRARAHCRCPACASTSDDVTSG